MTEEKTNRPDSPQLHDEIKASLASGLQGKEKFPVQPISGPLKGRLRKLNRQDLIDLTRQMSILWDVGIPLLRGLQILANRTSRTPVRRLVQDLGGQLEKGSSLSDALARHPRIFSPFYVGAIRAGESAGTVGNSFHLVGDYLETEGRLHRKFKSALSYPAITMAIALLVVVVLMVRVIPVFAKEYQTAGVELPGPTQFVLAVSSFMGLAWPVLLILAAALLLAPRFLGENRIYRSVVDRIWLLLPGVGTLTWRILTFRFARLTSTMLSAGVPVLSTLNTTASAIGNVIVGDRIQKASVEVEQGGSVAAALEKTRAFPGMVTDMIAVGEETGSVDAIMERMSKSYEEDVEAKLEGLATMIEPVMILVLGGIVLIIALAMFMPYFNIQQVILSGNIPT